MPAAGPPPQPPPSQPLPLPPPAPPVAAATTMKPAAAARSSRQPVAVTARLPPPTMSGVVAPAAAATLPPTLRRRVGAPAAARRRSRAGLPHVSGWRRCGRTGGRRPWRAAGRDAPPPRRREGGRGHGGPAAGHALPPSSPSARRPGCSWQWPRVSPLPTKGTGEGGGNRPCGTAEEQAGDQPKTVRWGTTHNRIQERAKKSGANKQNAKGQNAGRGLETVQSMVVAPSAVATYEAHLSTHTVESRGGHTKRRAPPRLVPTASPKNTLKDAHTDRASQPTASRRVVAPPPNIPVLARPSIRSAMASPAWKTRRMKKRGKLL